MNRTKGFKIITVIAIILAVLVSYLGYQNNQTNKELATLQNELKSNNNLLQSTKNELTTTQENLQAEVEKSIKLNDSINNMNSKLEKINSQLQSANTTITELKKEEYTLIYLGSYKLTHYCNESYEHICGYGDGLTATGTEVTPGRTIAVDPDMIPYGSKVYIEGYGWRTAEDCGGGVNGKHIDVAVDTHSKALDMGTKYGGVWLLVQNGS